VAGAAAGGCAMAAREDAGTKAGLCGAGQQRFTSLEGQHLAHLAAIGRGGMVLS